MEQNSSQKNQEIKQNTHGGYRQGAGRKPMYGNEEETKRMRRLFGAYISDDEYCALIDKAYERAQADDGMLRFVIEQTSGKATQHAEIKANITKSIDKEEINRTLDDLI